MKKNLSATKKGPGRFHKNGVQKIKRRQRPGATGGFAQALTDWITQENLKGIR